jgi:hypothetical protein
MKPRQGALFPVTVFPMVHLWRRHRVIPDFTCVMCAVSQSVAAIYADCDSCPGYVAPVPRDAGLQAEAVLRRIAGAA